MDSRRTLPPHTLLLLHLVSPFHPVLPGFSYAMTRCRLPIAAVPACGLYLLCWSFRGKSPWICISKSGFLVFHAPHPICKSPVPQATFPPHYCQHPAFPHLQPVALAAPPAPLASPAVMLCISPTVTTLSILSFLFSQPAVQVFSSRMGKTCKAEIARQGERNRGY